MRISKLDRIKELINNGLSNKEIVNIVGGYTTYISRVRLKYNLQKSPRTSGEALDVDWNHIEKMYADGYSMYEISSKLNIRPRSLYSHFESKDIKRRQVGESRSISNHRREPMKMSEESKQKIREFRIRHMQDHPNETTWLRKHQSEKSNPEIIFEKELIERNITGWIYNYRVNIYKYDFAFVDLKLDVEIDGEQHERAEQAFKDKLRDEFTMKNGWTVLRFKVKEDIQKNLSKTMDKLEKTIADLLSSRVMVAPLFLKQ